MFTLVKSAQKILSDSFAEYLYNSPNYKQWVAVYNHRENILQHLEDFPHYLRTAVIRRINLRIVEASLDSELTILFPKRTLSRQTKSYCKPFLEPRKTRQIAAIIWPTLSLGVCVYKFALRLCVIYKMIVNPLAKACWVLRALTVNTTLGLVNCCDARLLVTVYSAMCYVQ